MEVALLAPNSIKIRSKIASLVVNPSSSVPKTEADAVILMGPSTADTSKISDFRVTLAGPGEYEINGVKITSVKSDKGSLYKLALDKMGIILATASSLSKIDNAPESQVVIMDADIIPSDKSITSMQASVVIFYGEKRYEAAKTLKDEAIAPIGKFSVTSEKLPQELEVVILE